MRQYDLSLRPDLGRDHHEGNRIAAAVMARAFGADMPRAPKHWPEAARWSWQEAVAAGAFDHLTIQHGAGRYAAAFLDHRLRAASGEHDTPAIPAPHKEGLDGLDLEAFRATRQEIDSHTFGELIGDSAFEDMPARPFLVYADTFWIEIADPEQDIYRLELEADETSVKGAEGLAALEQLLFDWGREAI